MPPKNAPYTDFCDKSGPPYDKLVDETEDELVDTRGNICLADKNWGMFIVRYPGKR